MRSEPRMPYTAPVSLRIGTADEAVVGEMHNLSRRGMFVRVAPPPPLGTQLLCELPGQRELHGRVAWVFNAAATETAPMSGVGIEFVDASTDAMIDELIGARVDEGHPLKVWFAGLPSHARALGRVTDDGVELSTTLDFLRLGSSVAIAPAAYADGARLRGTISRVALRTDGGAPRLTISLAMGGEVALPMPTVESDARWFPEIVVESDARHGAPAMLVEPEHTERTPLLFEAAPAGPAPSRLRPTLTVAAVILLVALVVLRVGFPAVEQAPALPPPAIASPEPEPEPQPQPEAAPVAVAAPVAAPVPAPVPVPVTTPGADWKPTILFADGQPTIAVPFTGSSKGHETFSLDNPPGIFIDLPAGKAAVPMRSYLLHDNSFRSLWVRVRPKGGLQVRLHVAKGTQVSVDVSDGMLHFRKKP